MNFETNNRGWHKIIDQEIKKAYRYDADDLWVGGSYGNERVFARTDKLSNLAGLWLAEEDRYYCGSIETSFTSGEAPLKANETWLSAAFQMTSYGDSEGLYVEKTVLVPLDAEDSMQYWQVLRIINSTGEELPLTIRTKLIIPAVSNEKFKKEPFLLQMERVAEMSVLQGEILIEGDGRETDSGFSDRSCLYIGKGIQPSTCKILNPSRVDFKYTLSIRPGEEVFLPYVFSIDTANRPNPDKYEAVLLKSIEHINRLCQVSSVFTPDGVINRGVYWGKVNSLRVLHRFPVGLGFTNNPPGDTVVIRDLAWFTHGSDYFLPESSKSMFELVKEYGVCEDGKLAEYIYGLTGVSEDYGMNMNDDTPLFLMAVYHHYLVTGDKNFAARFYPLVHSAAQAILNQTRDGLVYNEALGTNVFGLATWRNVVPGYRINGFVTEVNCECYAALSAAGHLAEAIGNKGDAAAWEAAASTLKQNIQEKLLDKQSGYYLLNIDSKGRPQADLTADLVFPTMLGVADDETNKHIFALLNSDSFMTPFGARTIGNLQPEYEPDHGIQLLGGIWPNLTAWIAYACRKVDPDAMVNALRNIYRLSEVERPVDYEHVCPGEFAERLHGDTGISRGMAMSPWMPPTYVWAVVEGILGVTPRGAEMAVVEPNLQSGWDWAGIRNLQLSNTLYSLIFTEGIIYSTYPVESMYPVIIGCKDITDRFISNVEHFVLETADGEYLVALYSREVCNHVKAEVWEAESGNLLCNCEFSATNGRLVRVVSSGYKNTTELVAASTEE